MNHKKYETYTKTLMGGIGTFSFTIYPKTAFRIDSFKSFPFIVSDAFDFVGEADGVIELYNLYVEVKQRRRGYGEQLFEMFKKEVVEKYPNHLIVIKAAPLVADYPDPPNSDEWEAELQRQSAWLTKHGFIDFNEFSQFETGIAFAYDNGKIELIKKYLKEHEKK